MKHLLFTLLCVLTLTLTAFTQNGGQVHENGAIKVEYAGKIGTRYYMKVTNKQNCRVSIKISLNGDFDDANISALGTYLYSLGSNPPGAFTFKAKSTTDCGCSDNGWVEYRFVLTPLTFTSVVFQRDATDKNRGVFTFKIADVKNVKHIIVRAWIDVNTKIELSLTWPDPLAPNTTYQYVVNDIKGLAKQLKERTTKQ